MCFGFPPYPGIGGRRWAKFAKYLRHAGNEVLAVAAESPFEKQSEWTADAEDIEVVRIPSGYPAVLQGVPSTFFEKVSYRLALLQVRAKSKGNYYDRGILMGNLLYETCAGLINRKGIEVVIVSGAPFSFFTHLSPLKKQFPRLRMIADLRDPWTSNNTSYGYGSLSDERLNFEKENEKNVFGFYDKVITVSHEMTGYFKKLYPGSEGKFTTIENGYDPAETSINTAIKPEQNPEFINFIFAGSMYPSALRYFRQLTEVVGSPAAQGSFSKFRFYFYGGGMQQLSQMVPASARHQFFFPGHKPLPEINRAISASDFAMLFLSDDITYSLSTKFCEYIKFRKKIIVFSDGGWTSDYIVNNGIGFAISTNTLPKVLLEIAGHGKAAAEFPAGYDSEYFSIARLTERLEKVVEEN